MTVKELKDAILQKDGEGNGYSPIFAPRLGVRPKKLLLFVIV